MTNVLNFCKTLRNPTRKKYCVTGQHTQHEKEELEQDTFEFCNHDNNCDHWWWKMKKYQCPGSNWEPFACEANVITIRPHWPVMLPLNTEMMGCVTRQDNAESTKEKRNNYFARTPGSSAPSCFSNPSLCFWFYKQHNAQLQFRIRNFDLAKNKFATSRNWQT